MSSYTPRSFAEILAELVAHARAATDKVTDFNVGSVTRSWLEAAAIGLDSLWMQTAQDIAVAIPEATYLAFGFGRLPAAYALGEVTLYLDAARTEDVVFPAGTRVVKIGSAVDFLTVSDATIPAGALEVTVLARATANGAGANVGIGDLSVLPDYAGIGYGVTNRSPITGGRGEESDAERQQRFGDYIASLSRATTGALEYAARLATVTADEAVVEQALHVFLSERPGTVDVYIHNGVGGTSAELIARAREIIEGADGVPGYRAAGIEARYFAMIDVPLDIAASVEVEPGYELSDIQASMQADIVALLRGFAGGELTVPTIVNTLYAPAGVRSVEIAAPLSAQTYDATHRPVFGSLVLNA